MDNRWYILLVEDDPVVQANNKKILERRGYKTKSAFTLAEARAIIAEEPPCVIILDIQLPDGDGRDFLRELRLTSAIPVLMLTAFNTPVDVTKGLEAGGDIYLSKPYEINVFLAYLEALLRRAFHVPNTIAFGPFKLDPASVNAYLNGENMLLTQKEFALFLHFIQNADKTLSAEYLYEKVWVQPMNHDAGAVKNQVYNLRKKLSGSGFTISVERGSGYCFEQE